ncbi:MAG: condensation domain-containing protein, partial [Nitrosomonas sp.]|uniref:condensation domain-containing protein n=1 Tax=Nitrosomonas sp. TaxID=42353 RepID=UPI00273341F3
MADNDDLARRRARLTPEQRQRLTQRFRASNDSSQQTTTIPRRPAGESVHLSYAQQRHWFLWQLDPQSTAYHLGGGLRLLGELNIEALQASFQGLITRHESLRTVFQMDEAGLPQQKIDAAGK